MKVLEILEGSVVNFPSEKRGATIDPITGLPVQISDKPLPPMFAIVNMDGRGEKLFDTYKEAELYVKKMKLQGKQYDIIEI